MIKKPVLYSFRRCPYAIRARLAVAASGISVELREVVLKNKPQPMLDISPKGTVPVLLLPDGIVLEESRDIIRWALTQSDPMGWQSGASSDELWEAETLIQENDFVFKQHLDRYKYADRHPEQSQQWYREQGEVTLKKLEQRLSSHRYLTGDRVTVADIAIMPFIRQFASVDRVWFDQSPYPSLRQWLDQWLKTDLFERVMKKYPAWSPEEPGIAFPE